MPDYDLGTARGRIEIDASTLGRTSAALDGVGKSMLGLGALALAGFGMAVKASADFERTMSGVKAVLSPTEAEMEALRKKTLQLGQDTIFSAKDVAEGMEAMAKAGLTADEMLSGAADATVSLAAAAGNMELEHAAEIASNAMRMFQLPAEELVHVADVMAGAANASTVEVEDLAVSLRYAGSVAHAMGMDFDEVNTALAVLGDRGIRGSTAGTSLRGVLLSLTGTSGPAREALRELGIITEDGSNKFFDAAGNMRSMAEVAQVLQDATKGLSEEQRASAFNTIFQRRAMSSAIILADQGAEGFARYNAEIGRTTAAEVASEKLNNLSGDVEILRGSLETLVITAGATFQDALRGWVQAITKVVNWLSDLDESTLKTIMKVLLIGGAISALVGTFLIFLGAAVRVYRMFRDLQVAVRLFIGMMNLLKLTLLANPWVLLAAAIVALGVAIFVAYQKFESFREVIDKVFKWLQDRGLPTMQEFVDGVKGFWQDIVAWTKAHWAEIQEAVGHAIRVVQEVIGAFVDVVAALWRAWGDNIARIVELVFGHIKTTVQSAIIFLQKIIEAVLALINGDWGKAWDALKEAVTAAFAAIVSQLTTMPKIFFEIFKGMGDTLLEVWHWVWDRIKDAASGVWNWLQTNWKKVLLVILGIAAGPLTAIYLLWRLLGDRIKAAIGAALDAVVNFFKLLPGRVVGFLDMLWEAIWGVLSALPGQVITLGGEVLAAFVDFMSKLPERAGYFLGFVIGSILGFALEAVAKIIEFGIKFTKAIVDFMTKLPGKVWDFLTKTITKVKDFATDVIRRAVQLGIDFLQKVVEFMTKLPGRVWDFLILTIQRVGEFERQVIAKAIEIATSFVSKTIEFISGLPGKVWYWLVEVVKKITSWGIDAIAKGKEMAEKIVKAIIDKITELPGKVWDALNRVIGVFKDMVGKAFDAAKDFVGGLWDGFTAGLGGAIGGVVDAVTGGDNKAKGLKAMTKEVNSLKAAMRTIPTPLSNLGIAQGAGAVTRPVLPGSKPFPTATVTGADGTSAGSESLINIYGADQKTALQISREIMFQKRVTVSS